MGADAAPNVSLSGQDLMLLRSGLRAYLREFAEHRAEDGGASHPEAEWRGLQRHAGELIWRLEEAGVEPGTTVVHSEDAVDPAD